MTSKKIGFEGGTNAANFLTTSPLGSGDSAPSTVSAGAGAALTFSNTQAAHGSLGLKAVLASGTASFVEFTGFSGAQGSMRQYIYLPTLPSALTRLFDCRATGTICNISLTAANHIQMQDQAAVTYAFTNALATNTWYRIDFSWTINAGAAHLTCGYYLLDSTTPVETLIDKTNMNTGSTNWTTSRFVSAGSSTATSTMYFDDLGTQDANNVFWGPSGNLAPTANAGVDQSNIVAGSTVQADGSLSSDPESGTLTYLWTQISGPTVLLSSYTAQKPTFTAPKTTAGGTVVLGLTVTDPLGASSTQDTVAYAILPSYGKQIYYSSAWHLSQKQIRIGGVWVPAAASLT